MKHRRKSDEIDDTNDDERQRWTRTSTTTIDEITHTEIKTKKNIEITRTEQMGVTRTSRTKTQKWKDETRCAKIGPEKKAKTINANQRQRQR